MPIGEPIGDLGGTQYLLRIDGGSEIRFTACQNLGTKNEVVEHKITTATGVIIRKIPGAQKVLNIVLRRPMDSDMTLARWRRMVVDGKVDASRRNGTISVFNAEGVEIARWAFGRAWPSKLVSSITDGTEELTLAVETLSRL